MSNFNSNIFMEHQIFSMNMNQLLNVFIYWIPWMNQLNIWLIIPTWLSVTRYRPITSSHTQELGATWCRLWNSLTVCWWCSGHELSRNSHRISAITCDYNKNTLTKQVPRYINSFTGTVKTNLFYSHYFQLIDIISTCKSLLCYLSHV